MSGWNIGGIDIIIQDQDTGEEMSIQDAERMLNAAEQLSARGAFAISNLIEHFCGLRRGNKMAPEISVLYDAIRAYAEARGG